MSETQTKHDGLTAWLWSGERGLSSEAIVAHLVYGGGRGDYPWDPDDFRRCELLLRQVPSLRPLMPKMAEVNPVWAGLVERWDEIVALIDEEAPGVWDKPTGGAPRAYALIRKIRREARWEE